MAVRERLRVRAALSRVPRWVTVLGIILVLAVLAGVAALLAMGTTGLGVRLGLTRAVTVVLRIEVEPGDSVQPPLILCNTHGGPTLGPDCNPPATGTITYTTPTGGTTYQYTALPSTRTVRVPLGGFVTLNATQGVGADATQDVGTHVVGCSILLNGRFLSHHITDTTSGPTCHARIPVRAVPSPR